MERFGEKLRTLRKQNGLTMRQLADVLDLKSTGHITELEKGRTYPSAHLVLKISLHFNVSADLLMRDDLELD